MPNKPSATAKVDGVGRRINLHLLSSLIISYYLRQDYYACWNSMEKLPYPSTYVAFWAAKVGLRVVLVAIFDLISIIINSRSLVTNVLVRIAARGRNVKCNALISTLV